jgi:nucleobase transporter 1/2
MMNFAAGTLVFLGIFGKFGGAVATIPRPVVGGLYCILFGLIAALGLRTVVKADLEEMRNILIIGFILYMGLSLPVYFENATIEIASAPWLAQLIKTVGSTGIAVTAILGLILDNLIPGSREMRGQSKYGEK